ncbi:bifunctional phosphopantothenoylcysteine decarboxylase/phosphopantothenate--cysteine ligase CoaBC [Saliniramus sp.]|uniref:bifunctional phosphopantothenoylcysteine decarboxylase/phosphopantothenate--cysteine ligase CoaBC n=1 Tax=Saliniramus sp. TaxID=2986772 RepID=UPI002B97568B|nr:bifunctional phosphopantothenoylcysteine decarboxylase/phosphopantothenate--cysteine ligase CoaBC [Saliniramus sp.]HMB12038.1 bifunctional phosphopantothenoylcysteine decarboxylase/phosphopantothenate--cysteine ligase CoaBC [Saliniramus sp.]
MTGELQGRRVLLIIGGGIAAYKSLDLIRRLRDAGSQVRCVMTAGAQEFVTPLAAAALSGEKTYTDLFDRADEAAIGHIRLARDADCVVVAPATANLMARMAQGHADDLATTVLLATRLPVLIAPAMNPAMWSHPATQRNLATLTGDGVRTVGPGSGPMAEPETGAGRMAEPMAIVAATQALFDVVEAPREGALAGRHVLVTSGPTHEPIDPVRYIANRSSGRQGHAIAAAAARAGARVTLVSGPVGIPAPPDVDLVPVETARQMQAAVEAALPADIAIFAAAVADWRTDRDAARKIKKDGVGPPTLALVENPDILAMVAAMRAGRPGLVVGFAAETHDVIALARAKRARKGCDLIVANDVSAGSGVAGGVMGGARNAVHLIDAGDAVTSWPEMDKDMVAERLIAECVTRLDAAGEFSLNAGSPA